ncbi:DUF3995 domain-containing protein [Leucobacter iarius]|uniref:DUF3995 domain-containing protein n=1 Tax=Leucobacter iarius TaxID=333963 RepID=A0ABP4XL56_9MICO
MSALKGFARLIAWTGLTAVGALHLAWASGSPWPAKNRKRLAESVVGNAAALPEPTATAVVGATALVGGAIAGGALGESGVAVAVRRTGGAVLLARAAFGGDAALAVLGLPPAGKRFRELDRRFYRPLCGVLGAAMIIAARRRRGDETD